VKEADPFDLQGQERAAQEVAKRDELSKDTEESDFKWLMRSKRGRRIVWRQLERAGVFRLSFNTNAMAMAFAEGNKNDGLRTLGLINRLCPELYQTMVNEANDHRANSIDGNSHNDH